MQFQKVCVSHTVRQVFFFFVPFCLFRQAVHAASRLDQGKQFVRGGTRDNGECWERRWCVIRKMQWGKKQTSDSPHIRTQRDQGREPSLSWGCCSA